MDRTANIYPKTLCNISLLLIILRFEMQLKVNSWPEIKNYLLTKVELNFWLLRKINFKTESFYENDLILKSTLESLIDVGQGISVGPGRFGKKKKRRALNKRRAWKIWKK